MRDEKGLSTSGLLAERMTLSRNPSIDSFAQRSWLPDGDKSLNYKFHGNAPVAKRPEGMSLQVGTSKEAFKGWAYGRKAALTGNILTVTGSNQAGVFLDDNYFV